MTPRENRTRMLRRATLRTASPEEGNNAVGAAPRREQIAAADARGVQQAARVRRDISARTGGQRRRPQLLQKLWLRGTACTPAGGEALTSGLHVHVMCMYGISALRRMRFTIAPRISQNVLWRHERVRLCRWVRLSRTTTHDWMSTTRTSFPRNRHSSRPAHKLTFVRARPRTATSTTESAYRARTDALVALRGGAGCTSRHIFCSLSRALAAARTRTHGPREACTAFMYTCTAEVQGVSETANIRRDR